MDLPLALPLEDFQNNYDWTEAFAYADKPQHVDPAVRAKGPEAPFTLADVAAIFHADVAAIFHADEGINDELDWVCLGQLHDGRWFVLSAGCDYTGWDCQASGDAAIADTYEQALALGLTDDHRRRLWITLDTGGSGVSSGSAAAP